MEREGVLITRPPHAEHLLRDFSLCRPMLTCSGWNLPQPLGTHGVTMPCSDNAGCAPASASSGLRYQPLCSKGGVRGRQRAIRSSPSLPCVCFVFQTRATVFTGAGGGGRGQSVVTSTLTVQMVQCSAPTSKKHKCPFPHFTQESGITSNPQHCQVHRLRLHRFLLLAREL